MDWRVKRHSELLQEPEVVFDEHPDIGDFGEVHGEAGETEGESADETRCWLHQFRNRMRLVAGDQRSEHVHKGSKRVVFVFPDLVGDFVQESDKARVFRSRAGDTNQ